MNFLDFPFREFRVSSTPAATEELMLCTLICRCIFGCSSCSKIRLIFLIISCWHELIYAFCTGKHDNFNLLIKLVHLDSV